MIACCCSNPGCHINGCMQVQRLQEQYGQRTWPVYPTYQPVPPTLDQIREIIREEVQRAKEQP